MSFNELLPIPDSWEVCEPKQCTQAWLSLAGDKLPVSLNLDHDMSVRINGEWISEQSWNILGIIPIRRIQVLNRTALLEQENKMLREEVAELNRKLKEQDDGIEEMSRCF